MLRLGWRGKVRRYRILPLLALPVAGAVHATEDIERLHLVLTHLSGFSHCGSSFGSLSLFLSLSLSLSLSDGGM